MRSKIGRTILKFAPPLIASRNATLFLLRINGARFAHLLYRFAKDKNNATWLKLQKLWSNLGGNPAELLHVIKKGVEIDYKHHKNDWAAAPVFNFDMDDFVYPDSFEPITTATAAATATPLIVKIMKIIKDAGIDPKEVADGLTGLAKKGMAEMAKKGTKKIDKNGNPYVVLKSPEIPLSIAVGKPKQDGSKFLIPALAAVAAAYFIFK